MSATLPTIDGQCCLPVCDDVVVQNIPGPAGTAGTNGTNGTDGVSAVTTLTADFTMPAELGEDTAQVDSTAGLVIGQNVYMQGLGTLQVTGIISPTQATLLNLMDTPNDAYMGNIGPGNMAGIGSQIGPSGVQGPAGIIAGTPAGGDLEGTYPNPPLRIPKSLGALIVGNSSIAVSLAAGTNGMVPVNDTTTFPATGLGHKKIIPVTGDANVAADRLARLSSATGLPIPLTASRASLKDPGGAGLFVADATTGNARGSDAVDLQVNRPTAGATGVASGSRSVIVGGEDNTASGQRSVVVGGNGNTASAIETFVGGGDSNTVDSTQSTIAGGDTNSITGGTANESFIGGGNGNAITGAGQSVIAGGVLNAVNSQYGAVLGGATNLVTGVAASIAGGLQATADKFGQRAFSAGRFAAQSDCQQSELIWRIATVGIVGATEMFLDGASLRATIASGRTVLFDILISARSSTGTDAAWQVKGLIHNNAGTTALVGAVTNTLIADGSGGSAFGTLGNVPVVSADDPNDALVIKVINPSATNLRWVAHGRLVEVGY